MAGYILALDQGTTSSRAIIYDDTAQAIAMVQKPTTLITPKSGYVEQDAMQIWHTQLSCAHDVINQAGLLATDIDSIAITNQRETIVLWDTITHKPLAPAIIWQDRRTTSWCQQLVKQRPNVESQVQSISGLRLDPYFSASKIHWLITHRPEIATLIQNQRVAVGTVDSWLIYKLTGGEHVTDITNASRTLLFDINNAEWSDDLLGLFDLPVSILPKVLPCDAHFGKTKKGLFAKQIPIEAAMGDQQAALFGHGCVKSGMAKNTYGTGCFMLMNTGKQVSLSQHKLLTTVAWQFDSYPKDQTNAMQKLMASGKRLLNNEHFLTKSASVAPNYALEGSVFMAGAIVQWLRDNLGLIKDSDDIETLAKQVNGSDGVMLLPAFTGIGAPYWRTDATASIIGMTRGTTKAHIARAALEAIALQVADVLFAMQKDSEHPLSELRVDGGAAKNNLLMQYQADLLGVPVLRPKDTEVTAKGVAMLSGLKSGLYDQQTYLNSWQVDKEFLPSISADERHSILERWQSAMTAYL